MSAAVELQDTAETISLRPEPSGESLADDGNERRAGLILRTELASCEHRNTQCSKQARAYGLLDRRRPRLQRPVRHALVLYCHASTDAGREWSTRHEADCLNR